MTDVSPSKGHVQPKLPSLTVIVSKLSSLFETGQLKQYLLEVICGERC